MPPKDIERNAFYLRFARGIIDGSIVSAVLSAAFRNLIENKDEDKLVKKLINKTLKRSEIKESGFDEQAIKNEIDNQRTILEDRENPDKIQTRTAEQRAQEAALDSKATEIYQIAKSEAQQEILKEESKAAMKEVRKKEREKRNKARKRVEEKLDVITTRQLDQPTKEDVKEIAQDIKQSINTQLQTFRGGEYKDRKIQQIEFPQRGIEIKSDEKIGGLGLNRNQRNELKQIIKNQAGQEYANSFDLIAGDDVDVNNLFDGLVGIALSAAVPIPSHIISRLSGLMRNELGLDINKLFHVIDEGDNKILLIDEQKANEGRVEIQMIKDEGKYNDKKLDEEYKRTSSKQKKKIDEQIKEKKTKNKKKLVNAAQTGAMIGAAAGYLTGSPTSAIMGGSAGALIGATSEIVSRSDLPQIAEQVSQRIIDATPRLPTVEGVRRGVRRAITTGRQEVKFNVPELGYRTEQETKNILETKANELVSAIQSTNNKELRESLTNQYIAITSQIDMIDEFGLQPYDQDRLTIRQRERRAELPYIRPTTDEEKALVPFDESKERYSKQKSMAIIGSAGAALAAVGAERYRENIPSFFREEPVQLPNDILTEQQDKIEKMQGKGLLRPKFIIPSTNILQPSDQELAADALEFAAFDFVRPNTEGGEGDLQTNILKRSQKLNENIRFQGAGVRVNSLFGYDLPVQPSQETINNLFLYKALPPLKFQEQEYNLSEFEVMSYDPINQRGAIEMFSPYNDFSDTIPDDKNEMDMSILFSIVP